MHKSFLIEKSRELRTNQTDAERFLWSKIRNKQLGHRFNRQHVFDSKYIVDFYCAERKLIIELDGGQHCECETDAKRDNYLITRGYSTLRFWNNEVLENIEGCLLKISEFCKE